MEEEGEYSSDEEDEYWDEEFDQYEQARMVNSRASSAQVCLICSRKQI